MRVATLVRGMLTGGLGVNPAETIQLQTGRWALKFLFISLAVTPIRRLTRWNVVIQFRRMLGRFASFYPTLHMPPHCRVVAPLLPDAALRVLLRVRPELRDRHDGDRRLQAPVHRPRLHGVPAAHPACGAVAQGLDPAAREEVDAAAPARLRRRDPGDDPFRVEGEGVHRRSGALRRHPPRAARLLRGLGAVDAPIRCARDSGDAAGLSGLTQDLLRHSQLSAFAALRHQLKLSRADRWGLDGAHSPPESAISLKSRLFITTCR